MKLPQASLKMEPNLAALKSNIVHRQLGHWISSDDFSPEFPSQGEACSLFMYRLLCMNITLIKTSILSHLQQCLPRQNKLLQL